MKFMVACVTLLALIFSAAPGFAAAPAPVTIPGRPETQPELLLPRYEYALSSVERVDGRLLISYNRGAQVVLGMPLGFYEGYEEEIHEIFVYDMKEIER